MTKLGYRDFLDIALGGTILGTGGGGSHETASHLAEHVLRRKNVRLVPLRGIPDIARVVSIAGMGSPEAMLKTPFTTEARRAFDSLGQETGHSPKYVVPLETSGFNFLVPMTVASSRPVSVIDADAAGRAIPRLNQTLFHSRRIPLAPLALADARGQSIVVRACEYALAEKVALTALEHFGWSAGLACYGMDGKAVKRAGVEGTVSLAREVGRAVRRATLSGGDPFEAVLRITGGWKLISGLVDRFDTETVGSYKFGNLEIQGMAADSGHRVRVKSMNENMIAWKDDRLAAVAPDRICFMEPGGQPITNADIVPGDEIAAFVIQAQRKWLTRSARSLFDETLTAMGYTGGYIAATKLAAA
jgi:uncharacterized protein